MLLLLLLLLLVLLILTIIVMIGCSLGRFEAFSIALLEACNAHEALQKFEGCAASGRKGQQATEAAVQMSPRGIQMFWLERR